MDAPKHHLPLISAAALERADKLSRARQQEMLERLQKKVDEMIFFGNEDKVVSPPGGSFIIDMDDFERKYGPKPEMEDRREIWAEVGEPLSEEETLDIWRESLG